MRGLVGTSRSLSCDLDPRQKPTPGRIAGREPPVNPHRRAKIAPEVLLGGMKLGGFAPSRARARAPYPPNGRSTEVI